MRRSPGLHSRSAFSLVELLVVISIIALLIALLLPALARARYGATLVLCKNSLRQAGVGLNAYAVDNAQRYPYRRCGLDPHPVQRIFAVRDLIVAADDRPMLKPYMDVTLVGSCPFSPLPRGRSYNEPTLEYSFLSYGMWFGIEYELGDPQTGLFRVDQRPRKGSDRFSVLMGDLDLVHFNPTFLVSHPGAGPNFPLRQYDGDPTMLFSLYQGDAPSPPGRNPIDVNYVFADGSARTLGQLRWADTTRTRLILPNPALGSLWGNYYLPPD